VVKGEAEERGWLEVGMVSTVPKQMNFDFGERFSEIAHKEVDKAVVYILKGCAMLDLDEETVNAVMSLIAEENSLVLSHQGGEE
jgi:hypothetical protein